MIIHTGVLIIKIIFIAHQLYLSIFCFIYVIILMYDNVSCTLDAADIITGFII